MEEIRTTKNGETKDTKQTVKQKCEIKHVR